MADEEIPTEVDERLLRGLDLFDAGEHDAAHEELEELWSGEVGETRHLLQALIQAAVALHHRGNGNLGGARVLLERALDHLAAVQAPRCFIDPRPLAATLTGLQREVAARILRPQSPPEPAPIPRFDATRARIRARRRELGLPGI